MRALAPERSAEEAVAEEALVMKATYGVESWPDPATLGAEALDKAMDYFARREEVGGESWARLGNVYRRYQSVIEKREAQALAPPEAPRADRPVDAGMALDDPAFLVISDVVPHTPARSFVNYAKVQTPGDLVTLMGQARAAVTEASPLEVAQAQMRIADYTGKPVRPMQPREAVAMARTLSDSTAQLAGLAARGRPQGRDARRRVRLPPRGGRALGAARGRAGQCARHPGPARHLAHRRPDAPQRRPST